MVVVMMVIVVVMSMSKSKVNQCLPYPNQPNTPTNIPPRTAGRRIGFLPTHAHGPR